MIFCQRINCEKKNFAPYKTRVPYCRRFQDDQHAFTLLKSIAGMVSA